MILLSDRDGERADALLARLVPELSRSQAQRLLDEGRVTRDGVPLRKSDRVKLGDALSLELPELREVPLEAQDIPLDVVYEDDDLIVVNKPKGIVVHPAPGHPDGTLVNALLHHCAGSLSGIGGALNSSGLRSRLFMRSRPSIARPSGSTTRPRSSSPTGTLAIRPTLRTRLSVSMCSYLPNTTHPMTSGSISRIIPRSPHSNSITSPYMISARPSRRQIPSETESTRPSWNSSIRGTASEIPAIISAITLSASKMSSTGRLNRSRSR